MGSGGPYATMTPFPGSATELPPKSRKYEDFPEKFGKRTETAAGDTYRINFTVEESSCDPVETLLNYGRLTVGHPVQLVSGRAKGERVCDLDGARRGRGVGGFGGTGTRVGTINHRFSISSDTEKQSRENQISPRENTRKYNEKNKI